MGELLARVALVEPQRSLFHEAGLLPGASLRSLDALHLATALRIDAAVVVAYDVRQETDPLMLLIGDTVGRCVIPMDSEIG